MSPISPAIVALLAWKLFQPVIVSGGMLCMFLFFLTGILQEDFLGPKRGRGLVLVPLKLVPGVLLLLLLGMLAALAFLLFSLWIWGTTWKFPSDEQEDSPDEGVP